MTKSNNGHALLWTEPLVSTLNLPPRQDLSDVQPGLLYEQGFLSQGKKLPYYALTTQSDNASWSETMTDFIAESSKDHFIDRYNRWLVMELLADHLRRPGARYMDVGCSSGYL